MTATVADNSKKPPGEGSGRERQKERTRRAIVAAARELTRSGAEVTMPRVAERAMVSEATMYRYFPDLTALIQETLAGLWPDPAAALAPVETSAGSGGAGGLRLRVPAPRRARVPGLGARGDRPHDH